MKEAELLSEAARRLTADLRVRFPAIRVTLMPTSDRLVSVEVSDWGTSVGFDWLDEVAADYDESDVESLLEHGR